MWQPACGEELSLKGFNSEDLSKAKIKSYPSTLTLNVKNLRFYY